MTDLCSYAPVEPAHVGGMPEVGVDPARDQHVALGFLILYNMVEVGASRQHGCLTQALTTQHHEQTQDAQPVQLLQF